MIHRAYIGIDPGTSPKAPGAAAIMQGRTIEVRDWDGYEEMTEQIRVWMMLYDVQIAIIEQVHAISYPVRNRRSGAIEMKSQKGSANFKFGENYGWWQGLFWGLGIKHEMALPGAWMSQFPLQAKIKKADKPSLDYARQQFPAVDLKLQKNHGRADALLIADYARRKHGSPLR